MIIRPGVFISDRYEIIDKVGSGGMADVYKAKCHRLNRFVAMKVLKAEYSDDKKFVGKFRAEAQSAAGLSHPNIVNVYDVGEENGIYYIVMELVEGITLKNFIERKGHLEIPEAVGIGIQIAQGMEAAHSNHIIHRDIKPQNIIISKEGKVKVTDFGIAKVASSETITSNAMGSVHYISPEQARGGFSDEKSDIYSLGVTLYEMLTGRVPFIGDNTVSVALSHLQDDPIPLRNLEPGIPVSLDKIVQKCMQKKPENRYLSASNLIHDLKLSLSQPDGQYVQLVTSGMVIDSPTINISMDELEQIKSGVNKSAEKDPEDMFATRTNAVPTVTEQKNTVLRNEPEDEDEEEENEVDPRLEKLMVAGGVIAAVVLVLIVIFLIGKVSGFFGGGSNYGSENKTPEPSSATATQMPEESASPAPTTTLEEMENVVGMTIAEARRRLEAKGWSVKYTEEQSDNYNEGIVIRQDQKEGTPLEEGSVINLVVSSGKVTYTVPDVYGNTANEASEKLQKAGYIVVHDSEYSDTVEKDRVVRTSPAKGSAVSKGDTITIYISKGAEEKTVRVPDVTDLTLERATQKLESAGLKCSSEVKYAYSSTVAKGKVISQSYSANTSVAEGTAVILTVSLGEKQQTVTKNYKYYGDITINYNPFSYDDESGKVKLLLKQDGKSKVIYEKSNRKEDFPIVLNDIEGYSESKGEIYMYLDGVRVGDVYSISFTKVEQ